MIGGLVAVLGRHLIEIVKLKTYAVACYAAAGLSLLFALVFALVSLRHWIVMTFNASYPDLWIAAMFIAIAAAMVGAAMYLQRKAPPTQPAADIALIAGPPAARLVLRRLSPRTVAVAVVLIAGLIVGRRMAQRAT